MEDMWLIDKLENCNEGAKCKEELRQEIKKRLSCMHLDKPYNEIDEGPLDVFHDAVDYIQRNDRKDLQILLRKIFNSLLDEDLLQKVTNIEDPSKLKWLENLLVVYSELFNDEQPIILTSLVHIIRQKANNDERFESLLCAALNAVASVGSEDPETVSMLQNYITHSIMPHVTARIAYENNLQVFLDNIFVMYTEKFFAVRQNNKQQFLNKYENNLRKIFELSKRKKQQQSVLPKLKSIIRDNISHSYVGDLKETFLRCLSLSNWRGMEILTLDNDYWKITNDHISISPEDKVKFFEPIHKRAEEKFSKLIKEGFDVSQVKMNKIPFTEHIFQIIFRDIIEHLFDDLTVAYDKVSWSMVPIRLSNGGFDLAICNDHFNQKRKSTSLNRIDDIEKVAGKLFSYRYYDMLIHEEYLTDKLRDIEHDNIDRAISNLYSGGIIKNKDILKRFLDNSSIVLPIDTDIAEKTKKLIYDIDLGMDDLTIDGESSPDNVYRFLNGEYDIFVGGANDSEYLTNHFSHECTLLTRFDEDFSYANPAINYFFKRQEDDKTIYETFLTIWSYIPIVWKILTKNTYSRIEDEVIEKFKVYYTSELNRALKGGNFEGFCSIKNVIDTHDDFHIPDKRSEHLTSNNINTDSRSIDYYKITNEKETIESVQTQEQ